MVTLTIDDRLVVAPQGRTILQAARAFGIDIPTLCYHEALSPYGACRLCVVEVIRRGHSRLFASCTYPVEEGLVVRTQSSRVLQARRMIVELLLARCPNVPVVRRLAEELGVERPRFKVTEESNCILCGLCVRMCDEVVGAHAISFVGRGTGRDVDTPFRLKAEACIACGACAAVCPTRAIRVPGMEEAVARALPLGPTTAVYVPFLQAVPNVPVIDRDSCIHFKTGGCQLCQRFCEQRAIDHEMEPEYLEVDVGAIILATGHDFFDARKLPQYNYGVFPNVVDSTQFERMCNAAGPTGGEIRLANGNTPRSVCFIHCVGCRDAHANSYCSRLCCMHAMKQAHLVKEKTGADVYELYIDIRAGGKGYEEFYERVQREGVIFIRGRGAEVMQDGEQLVVKTEDTGLGRPVTLTVDMVVLVTGLTPQGDADRLAKTFHVTRDKDGFFLEAHPKLRPFETNSDGIYIAGTCHGPKDIPDTVAHANAAAAEVLSLLGRGVVDVEAATVEIDPERCAGCKTCLDLCAYGAIDFDRERKLSRVNAALCKGCGVCAAACPTGAAQAHHFRDDQILAEIEGILAEGEPIVVATPA